LKSFKPHIHTENLWGAQMDKNTISSNSLYIEVPTLQFEYNEVRNLNVLFPLILACIYTILIGLWSIKLLQQYRL
jgi:hypothetical protein